MDYVRVFDVELDRPVYYTGEMLTGHVYLEVAENMRLQNIKLVFRGKAHAEWKITRAGERRTIKQDEHYIDERLLLWGKDDNDAHQGTPIMTRGRHRLPFNFQLPENSLPCSFESKIGSIRYYVRATLNIPYASCPQCIRYFTIVGPNIDCADERYLSPVSSTAKRNSCSLCCGKGPLLLRASLDRTSYVCGENIKLKADVQNGSNEEVLVICKIMQYVEFFINKGVLGLTKEIRHTVLEERSDKVPAHDTARLDDMANRLIVPVTPPTMIDVCGLVQIYYTFKLYLETTKGKGEGAEINFPITIATVPYRLPNNPVPDIRYEVAASNTEGGMYISPEFQLGQVYMGEEVDPETDQTILYRPVYVCVSENNALSGTDGNLLQVPSRQTHRSRENIRSSREQLAAEQAAMFQVEGKQTSAKPEDKFLKEITAKIANRQAAIGDEESEGVPGLREDSDTAKASQPGPSNRKPKQAGADSMHQALVTELRRHLSEGDDSSAPVHSHGAQRAEKPSPAKRPAKKQPPPPTQKTTSDEAASFRLSQPLPCALEAQPGAGDTEVTEQEPLLPPPPPDPTTILPLESPDSALTLDGKSPLCNESTIPPIPSVCPEPLTGSANKQLGDEDEEDLDIGEQSALLNSDNHNLHNEGTSDISEPKEMEMITLENIVSHATCEILPDKQEEPSPGAGALAPMQISSDSLEPADAVDSTPSEAMQVEEATCSDEKPLLEPNQVDELKTDLPSERIDNENMLTLSSDDCEQLVSES